MKTIICPSCEAELELSETIKEAECPYCGCRVENEWYSESAVDEDGPFYADICLSILTRRMVELPDFREEGLMVGAPIRDAELPSDLSTRLETDAESEEIYLVWEGEECLFALSAGGFSYIDSTASRGKIGWDLFGRATVSYDAEEELLTLGRAWFTMPANVGACIAALFCEVREEAGKEWERALLRHNGVARYCADVLHREIESGSTPPTMFGALAGSDAVYGSKLARIAQIFGIPEEEEVALFYDCSPFGAAKEGFAMTDSGVYFVLHGKKQMLDWQGFVDASLEYRRPPLLGLGVGAVKLNDIEIPVSGGVGKHMVRFFTSIREAVARASGEDTCGNDKEQ